MTISAAPAPRRTRAVWLGPALVAAAATIAVFARLDPAGDHPSNGSGPGLTVDESFNAGQGVQLADRLLEGDGRGFRRVDALLPDYPPLGRLWIGVCHEAAFLLWPPTLTDVPYSIACARTAPALAFGVTVFLVGWCSGRWFGPAAGVIAATALVLSPRSFGHAHLASLETCINLAYAAAVLYLADRWGGDDISNSRGGADGSRGALGTAAAGGVLLGLALLIKIQAVLLPAPVALWTLWRRGWRGALPLAVWAGVGVAVFSVGWPYLWQAPIDHGLQYLGRATERAVIYAWYGGQAVADRELPWHYPWVIWLTTVPLGLHALGGIGTWRGVRTPASRPRVLLLLSCALFPLVVFSVPGTPVYDGERLFSVSYPLWCALIGAGGAQVYDWLARRVAPRTAGVIVACLLATQSVGLIRAAPAWLCYYNLAVGGTAGAERLGLPVTYWGDGLIRQLLAETVRVVPPGARIAVAPVLHEQQWTELWLQSPALRHSGVQFVPYGSPEAKDCAYVLFFRRKEYLPEELRGRLDEQRIVAAVRREGVLLAALYRIVPPDNLE